MLEQRLDQDNDEDDSHSSSHPLIRIKHLYFVIAAIVGTEFCERLCYYGVQGSLNLFLQNELGQNKATASFHVAIFGGVCYLTPLIGGYIADTYLGRYYSILLFVTFYLIGIIGIAIISWILSEDNTNTPLQCEEILFWIALYLIALGTGGIKPNVSTLGAEQFETDEPQFSLKHDRSNTDIINELMPVSYNINNDSLLKEDDNFSLQTNPIYSLQTNEEIEINDINDTEDKFSSLIINELNEKESNQLLLKQKKQKESFFNWFYFSINLGSFFAFTVVAYLCQNINFGVGYSVPAIALFIGIIIFMLASKYYRIVSPQGSILSKVILIIFYGIKHNGLDKAKIKYGNNEVESVKSVIKLLPFLAFNVIYWCVYAQLSTLFYAQGCQMNIKISNHIEIPIATLGLFDVIPILILLPFFDRILIPYLRRLKFKVTMLQRMGCGFLFAMLSMISAGILEIWRKKASITNIKSACNSSDGNNSAIYVSSISIFWQIPQFIFVGISEVFISVTGLEFFFSQSPPEMRSILASFNLITTGFGSWMVGLFIMLVNINKNNLWITNNLNNGHLDYYFFMIGGLCFITFFAFLYNATKYKYNTFEKDLMVIDKYKTNEDIIYEDVMRTTPRIDDNNHIINKIGDQFNYSTPPQIKDMAKSIATTHT